MARHHALTRICKHGELEAASKSVLRISAPRMTWYFRLSSRSPRARSSSAFNSHAHGLSTRDDMVLQDVCQTIACKKLFCSDTSFTVPLPSVTVIVSSKSCRLLTFCSHATKAMFMSLALGMTGYLRMSTRPTCARSSSAVTSVYCAPAISKCPCQFRVRRLPTFCSPVFNPYSWP